MSDGKRLRSLPDLRTRSKLVLDCEFRDQLVGFAGGMTPNGAYKAARDKMYLETGDANKAEAFAKSCRFLAIVRRDHGQDVFDMIVSPKKSTPNRHGQKVSE